MDLFYPAGLYWLAALPLLLVPWLLRERPRRRIVAAIFLFRGAEPARRMRIGGRLRLRPLFWLQLLILLLLVATLVRPALEQPTTRAAVVIDDSASMRAGAPGGGTRFDAAREAALAAVARSPAGVWDLFRTSPRPQAIARGVDREEARSRLRALAPGRCADPDDPALADFLDGLAGGGYSAVHVLTDREAAPASPFEVTTVGEPTGNVALVDAAFTPGVFGSGSGEITLAVANFSEDRAGVRVTVADADGGESILEERLEIAAGATERVARSVREARRYHAALETRDALAVDDAVTVAGSGLGSARVLLVSRAAGGLEGIPGLRVEAVAPADYRPEMSAARDLVVFHLSAPAEPPPVPALYLLPPPAPFLPRETGAVERPALATPDPTHPAVRYLNPGALRPLRSLVFEAASGWKPLLVSGRGPALLAQEGRTPAATAGFDLLPFLGERNRPVSILTLDLLSFLTRGSGHEAGACGDLPGAAESDLRRRGALPLPDAAAAEPAPERITRDLWTPLAAVALVLLAIEALAHARGSRSRWPWALRLVVAGLLLLALLDPMRTVAGEPTRPVLLIDQSGSVLPEARGRRLDEIAALAFPSGPTLVFGTAEETNLEAALSTAASSEPGSAVFLVSDGWATTGDVDRVLPVLRERGIRVYPFAIEQRLAGNVGIARLSLPPQTRAGKSVRAEVVFRSDHGEAVSGSLTLRRGSRVLSRETLRVPPGETAVSRPVLVAGDGLIEFSATFDPAVADRVAADDTARAFVAVGGGRRALLLATSARENRFVESALTERGVSVETLVARRGAGLPDLSGYDLVILNDVPIGDLPRGAPEAIRARVREGGGLVMIGGPRSFGLGGYAGSPVEEALPVRMKPRERDEARNAIALLVDKSGSMQEERRMAFAKEAARQLVRRLEPRDRLTVIAFDRFPFLIVPLREIQDIRGDFEDRIARLRPAGGTRLYPALIEAQRELLDQEARRRHVIVLSDGLSEDAETAAGRRRYYDLALALAQSGITVSTIALGREADADFLERIASFGRGAFHQTDDPSNLPELVVGGLEQSGRERTLREERIRALPALDSPVVGAIVRTDPTWPPVLGLVETELKPRARLDVTTPDATPLVASWGYGQGRSVALATDAAGRWSDPWIRWEQWSPLWGEIAGWLAPAGEETDAAFALGYEDGAIRLDYVRYDENPTGPFTALVRGPGDRDGEIALERTAPGSFRGVFATDTQGDYRIEVRGPRGALTRPPLGFRVPEDVVAERPRPRPDWSLLRKIAEATGGAVNPGPPELVLPPAAQAKLPLAPWLLPAAMLLFIAELVTRRLTGEPRHQNM